MSVIAGVNVIQTSAIYFHQGFSCCPYYRGVRYSGVQSVRRELSVQKLSPVHYYDTHSVMKYFEKDTILSESF